MLATAQDLAVHRWQLGCRQVVLPVAVCEGWVWSARLRWAMPSLSQRGVCQIAWVRVVCWPHSPSCCYCCCCCCRAWRSWWSCLNADESASTWNWGCWHVHSPPPSPPRSFPSVGIAAIPSSVASPSTPLRRVDVTRHYPFFRFPLIEPQILLPST